VCVVGADELEYLADIDVFNAEGSAPVSDEEPAASGARYTAADVASPTAEEKEPVDGAGGVAGSPAPLLNLQLDLQPHEDPSLLDSEEADIFLNTPDPDKLFQLDAEKTAPAMDSEEATKFLNELWLESNLEAVDSWNEDDLFPDLI